jgi:hypothetical protein
MPPEPAAASHCCTKGLVYAAKHKPVLSRSHAAVLPERQLLDCCTRGHYCRGLKSLPGHVWLYILDSDAVRGAASCAVRPSSPGCVRDTRFLFQRAQSLHAALPHANSSSKRYPNDIALTRGIGALRVMLLLVWTSQQRWAQSYAQG